jgi:hypothetical protein
MKYRYQFQKYKNDKRSFSQRFSKRRFFISFSDYLFCQSSVFLNFIHLLCDKANSRSEAYLSPTNEVRQDCKKGLAVFDDDRRPDGARH